MIPFKLFVLLSAGTRHLYAADELTQAQAGAYAQAVAFGSKDLSVKRYTRRLQRATFPTAS